MLTNSLGADVALNNVSNYFDGPSCPQGTVGTWFAAGTVTVTDSTGTATIYAKLWDGTTVIASLADYIVGANQLCVIALSGRLATPAGNIRISVRDTSNTAGTMVFNITGNSKDCTLTVFRIG